MLSLYVHIPFCERKCKYCSFNVIPTEDISDKTTIINKYLEALKKEISDWGGFLTTDNKQVLNTLYFGGGTPSAIGKERMCDLIDHISTYFDLESLAELNIELNPYPPEEILEFVTYIQKKYKNFPRIRRSIGLQTFDSNILQESGRMYSFPAVVDFLRNLQGIKQSNSIFNFDFIAFGKFNISKKGNRQLRDTNRLNFFDKLIQSGVADSYSLYTLELFSGSERYEKYKSPETLISCKRYGTEDDVYEEFSHLKESILESGYQRYELSNFALSGKRSLHNMTYRNMNNYIGVGSSASSFLNTNSPEGQKIINSGMFSIDTKKTQGIRWTNTLILADYLQGEYIDTKKTVLLNSTDYLIEQFFLTLRTQDGISNINNYTSVLSTTRKKQLTSFEQQGFLIRENDMATLTDSGMDVYNSLITELLAKI